MPVFSSDYLHQLTLAILRAAGTPPEPAATVAGHLIAANLAGHDSHGVLLLPGYVDSVRRGAVLPDAQPTVLRRTPVATLVDARRTFGQVSTLFGTDLAVAGAREQGVSLVGIVRGTHIGRLGHYAERAAGQGVALLVTTGALGDMVAPFGGRRAALFTNPLAFGFPVAGGSDGGRDGGPFVLDFATSVVALGKVHVARAAQTRLPSGALIDRDGHPTTDPLAYGAGGALLPAGGPLAGHKGYALSLLSLLLSSVLLYGGRDPAGAEGVEGADGAAGEPGDNGATLLLALDAGLFGSAAAAGAGAAEVLGALQGSPPAPGVERVLTAGQPERATAARRRAEGIPLAGDTWRAIADCAGSLGVPLR